MEKVHLVDWRMHILMFHACLKPTPNRILPFQLSKLLWCITDNLRMAVGTPETSSGMKFQHRMARLALSFCLSFSFREDLFSLFSCYVSSHFPLITHRLFLNPRLHSLAVFFPGYLHHSHAFCDCLYGALLPISISDSAYSPYLYSGGFKCLLNKTLQIY